MTPSIKGARMPDIFLPCKIERGGFSSERTFVIDLADGSKLIGTADTEYLRDDKKNSIGGDQPPHGEQKKGLVQCRRVSDEDGHLVVEVPSADLIRVTQGDLVVM